MKVTAIIPVFNEERTIRKVLDVAVSSAQIDRVIVANDGSTDSTPSIVKEFGVEIVHLDRQSGKGEAVRKATQRIKSGIILFLDGDLVGLRTEHIDALIEPLRKGAAMSIGLRDKESAIANAIMPYFPLSGGERAIRADVFAEIRKNELIEGWGLESVMNDYCRKKGLKVVTVKLDGMDHIGGQTKKHGLGSFLKEVYDVGMTRIKLLNRRYD